MKKCEYRGALTENYVAQALVHSGYPLFYWTSEGKAELDFILEQEDSIYPLEIKSGTSSKKKSLWRHLPSQAAHPQITPEVKKG
jgi:predicted AAA+ superfamily ATPase